MNIPFIKPSEINIDQFNTFLQESIAAGQYTNFGPCEKKLTAALSEMCSTQVLLAANASLILDGIHNCMTSKGLYPLLPKWTFPATNLAVPFEKRVFGTTSTQEATLGFSFFENASQKNYVVTTGPFGICPPESYIRPNAKYWIVDNAAGATPDMHVVKAWLKKGADAVIVSLHATKGLSACEGGFIAFNSSADDLFSMYKNYVNFGFIPQPDGTRQLLGIGSNHKMSELSAAWCLAKLAEFESEYESRTRLSDRYEKIAKEYGIPYIHSSQAFWVQLKESHKFKSMAHSIGFDVRSYYAPLLQGITADLGADLLEKEGMCLPTWPMAASDQMAAARAFSISLDSYWEELCR